MAINKDFRVALHPDADIVKSIEGLEKGINYYLAVDVDLTDARKMEDGLMTIYGEVVIGSMVVMPDADYNGTAEEQGIDFDDFFIVTLDRPEKVFEYTIHSEVREKILYITVDDGKKFHEGDFRDYTSAIVFIFNKMGDRLLESMPSYKKMYESL